MSAFSKAEERSRMYGASLHLRGPEDYIQGYAGAEYERAVDEATLALKAMRAGIYKDVESAGDEAPYRVEIVSRPEYWVNGIAVGNITKLKVRNDRTGYEGEEPEYVQKYKRARKVAYLTLRTHSLEDRDFSDMLTVATESDDPHMATNLLEEINDKKIGPKAYIFTPQHTIDRAEQEREEHNAHVSTMQQALSTHATTSREHALREEIEDSRHPYLINIQHAITLRRHRGLRRVIREDFILPLSQVSLKPIIEQQILSEALGQTARVSRRI